MEEVLTTSAARTTGKEEDRVLAALAVDLIDRFNELLLLAGTMRAWKDEDLVREIEHSVGRDLQFIRLNGTLVGGLIGLALYALTHIL